MQGKGDKDDYLARQNADVFDDIVVVVIIELRNNAELEETREEERATEVINKLPDLVSLDGDEALVTAVLTILLLKHDARNASDFPLLGRYVLS